MTKPKKPKRIQRRRTKGWRMPKGAIYVGRPSKWGNPYIVGEDGTAKECVSLYEFWAVLEVKAIQAELRDHDLCCWCPIYDTKGVRIPCHADVLLEIANREIET